MALVLALALCPAPVALAQDRPSGQTQQFGAGYDTLTDIQRALVDGLYKRAGAILGTTLDPRKEYNLTRLSERTTFDAVTHALSASMLTEQKTGESLGRPIDLIDYVETAEGEVRGARGDRQFRLYVALVPGAQDRLARSNEFQRTADNTIYHQGYPTSYRQEGYPSVQFSISSDGTRADVDVDYRSSRFPAALVNGHLTAANSDVRAGNFDRHNERWSGLVNWWDGFLGALFVPRVDVPDDDPQRFPTTPRAGDQTIDVAVDDFLTAWLVEGTPNLALAYVDPEAYDCLALRLEQEGDSLDHGLAPLQMYVRMKTVNDIIGSRDGLEGTTLGLGLANPALARVDHRRPAQYSIYAVPRAAAEQMTCGSYSQLGALPDTPAAPRQREPYETFYSTFVIVGPEGAHAALGLVWQRRGGDWKIVSYQVAADDAAGANAMPDLRTRTAAVEIPRTQAPAALVAATERFLEDWLVRKRYDQAMSMVAPSAYACVNLYLDPGEPPRATAAEQQARLRSGLELVAERVGAITRLEDAIAGVEPADSRLRIVDQKRNAAFVLAALPDWAGPAASCDARLARGDEVFADERAGQGYGRYYATLLQFVPRAGETAVFSMAWERDGDRWRIVSYKIVEP